MNGALLANSLVVSGGATLLAAAMGWGGALGLAGLDPRWRRRAVTVALLALALPPFLVTNCWMDLLATAGAGGDWLSSPLYSKAGVIGILALLTWPIPLVLVFSAWARLEPAQLEVDPALRGGLLVRWLLWPAARPALGPAVLLTAVLCLNNFAVPALLQVKVLPAEVWVRFNTDLDPLGALTVGWPLMVAPLLLVWALRHTAVSWPHEQGPARARAWRAQLGRGWWWAGLIVFGGAVVLSVAVPLVELAGSRQTWTELPPLVRAIPAEIGNSLLYAAAAATVGVAGGWALASRFGGAGDGGRMRVGMVLWALFLIPGVLVGIGLIVVFNRPGLDTFYRSAGIVFLALSLRYLAVGWSALGRALGSVDHELMDAVRLEGASRGQRLRHVTWPQLAPAAGAAWYVVYLLCLWDVETLVMIYPPGGETLALRIFNLLHYGHTAQVNAACLVLLGLAMAPGAAWSILRPRRSE